MDVVEGVHEEMRIDLVTERFQLVGHILRLEFLQPPLSADGFQIELHAQVGAQQQQADQQFDRFGRKRDAALGAGRRHVGRRGERGLRRRNGACSGFGFCCRTGNDGRDRRRRDPGRYGAFTGGFGRKRPGHRPVVIPEEKAETGQQGQQGDGIDAGLSLFRPEGRHEKVMQDEKDEKGQDLPPDRQHLPQAESRSGRPLAQQQGDRDQGEHYTPKDAVYQDLLFLLRVWLAHRSLTFDKSTKTFLSQNRRSLNELARLLNCLPKNLFLA